MCRVLRRHLEELPPSRCSQLIWDHRAPPSREQKPCPVYLERPLPGARAEGVGNLLVMEKGKVRISEKNPGSKSIRKGGQAFQQAAGVHSGFSGSEAYHFLGSLRKIIQNNASRLGIGP